MAFLGLQQWKMASGQDSCAMGSSDSRRQSSGSGERRLSGRGGGGKLQGTKERTEPAQRPCPSLMGRCGGQQGPLRLGFGRDGWGRGAEGGVPARLPWTGALGRLRSISRALELVPLLRAPHVLQASACLPHGLLSSSHAPT